MHEHICLRQPEYQGLNRYIAEVWLTRLRNAGCQSIAEVTPIASHVAYPGTDERGRPALPLDEIKELSKRTGINIICATGYYTPEMAPALRGMDAETIADHMVQKIEDGFGNTGVYPGIVKVGAHHVPLTKVEERVFVAAGMAQSQTGVAVCCHSIFGPRNQMTALLKGGADPNHCYFSHVEAEIGWEGRSLQEEAEYLANIAHEGSSLLFNNFGFEHDTPWEDLVYLIKYLVNEGFASKILICIDANWTIQSNGTAWLEAEAKNPECRKRDYAYIFTRSVPDLLDAGISRETIQTFMVDNPRAILALSQ